MEKHSLDFHTTFRTLTSFRPSLLRDEGDALEKYLQRLTTGSTKEDAPTDWLSWLDKYETRIESEKDLWESKGADQWLEAREKYGKLANPRFVLRQWLLEEVIKALEEDIQKGRPTLLKVLEVCVDDRLAPKHELNIVAYRWQRSLTARGVEKMILDQKTSLIPR
jgi:uncharacterized protein YdiU (UPF0061 family)